MTHKTNGRFPWERQEKMKAAGYARDVDATRDLPYGEKFADFFRLCDQGEQGDFQIVLAAFPEILGDNYEELVSNLWRCAKAGLLVAFTPVCLFPSAALWFPAGSVCFCIALLGCVLVTVCVLVTGKAFWETGSSETLEMLWKRESVDRVATEKGHGLGLCQMLGVVLAPEAGYVLDPTVFMFD